MHALNLLCLFRMKILGKSAFIAVLGFMLASCQSNPVSMIFSLDNSVDLSQFETFVVESDFILDKKSNAYFDQAIKEAFIAKGYVEAKDSPDIYVRYAIKTHEDTRLVVTPNTTNSENYPKTTLEAVFEGSILINIVVAKSNKVVWKAMAERNLIHQTKGLNTEQINNDLSYIFSSIPTR